MGNKTVQIEVAKCDFKKPYVNLVYDEIDKSSGSSVRSLIPLKSSHIDCLIYDGLASMNL